MNRQDVINLAESIGLLYPLNPSSSEYNSPAHMRLISKLEKLAQGCYDKGFKDGQKDSPEKELT